MREQSVDIGYSQEADRLRLVLHRRDDRLGLWLTRRLTKAFLGKFAAMLESGVSADGSSRRAAVIFEHLEACAGGETQSQDSGQSDTTGAQSQTGPIECALVTTLNVSPRSRGFVFTLTDESGNKHELAVSRGEAHRLVNALFRKAVTAEWDLASHAGWLGEAEQARGHQGSSVAAAH